MKNGVMCVVLLLLAFNSLYAAEHVYEPIEGVAHTIRTGTSGGTCSPIYEFGTNNIVAYVCVDGDAQAIASAANGCGTTTLTGLCALGDGINVQLQASNQLNCPGGVSYNVSTGDDGGTCTQQGTGSARTVTCTNNANTSAANCSNGCGDTGGSGCCCQANTSGCNPGKTCH